MDGNRLREERTARDEKGLKFTQAAMAELIGIGVATYQKAEAGECVDASIASKIGDKLQLDNADLGIQPCAATPAAASDTTRYLDWLHKECSSIDIRGLIVGSGKAPRLPIEEIYIPLRAAGGGVTKEKGAPGAEGPASLDKALAHRKLVIVGDPGGGKSTFLRRLAYEQSGTQATQFPILIRIFTLDDFIHRQVRGGAPDTPEAHSADWIARYLAAQSAELNWGLDADFFRRKLRERSTLILLDGLDEVPNASRRESIARLFERATAAFEQVRFVVTTRPAAYEGKATLVGFETVHIGELDDEARDGFLKNWSDFLFKEDPVGARRHFEELRAALRARVEIRRMARNPLMLTALAVIQWNERKLPEQRADLYESILKWLAEAHCYPHRPQGQECLKIFGAMALEMQLRPGGRVKQIGKRAAAELIAPKFRDLPAEERESAALDFLENELVDSGIVSARGSSVEFWHLTFQEYLAARAVAGLNTPLEVLLKDNRWAMPEWREVVLLVPGVMIRTGEERVDAIFKAILDFAAESSRSLAWKARAAGLLGAMLADLRPLKYRPPDESRYQALMHEVLGIFDSERAAGINLKTRVEAAEALGQAGDPRLEQDNWITMPGGTFLMGAQRTSRKKPGYDPRAEKFEDPVREIHVKTFQIRRYPVTVAEYKHFVEDESSGPIAAPKYWEEQTLHPSRPVVGVNWNDANGYCKWAGLRLLTEEEWEFAARGATSRRYPWGNQSPNIGRANYVRTLIGGPTPVGLFPAGNTPEGVSDLAGNIWEWTSSAYDKQTKVLRGGSYHLPGEFLRTAIRNHYQPNDGTDVHGFRCARS